MRITAEFITSIARFDQLPSENLPEIALTGRSNVGKSSVINTLVGKAGLARTSNTPGRTQTLNYYRVTPEEKSGKPFLIVDMPGYGFAAVNKNSRYQWLDLVEQYLNTRSTLRGVIQIIDLRHTPQALDADMSDWLHSNNHHYAVVGNKADKLAKTKVPGMLAQVTKGLGVNPEDAIAFSAETGLGRNQLWHWMIDAIDAVPAIP